METKVIEVRDRGTFLPMLAVRFLAHEGAPDHRNDETDQERYLLRRAGFGVDRPYVLLMDLEGGSGEVHCDSFGWSFGARTKPVAHGYLEEHWDEVAPGDVICVEFILGERTKPKTSESLGESARRQSPCGGGSHA